jgi:propionate CoA-transferase
LSATPRDRKLCTAAQAASLIEDGQTLGFTSFGAGNCAEAIQAAIEQRFISAGHPRDITVMHAAGAGNRNSANFVHFAHEGLLKRHIGAHFAWMPRLGAFIAQGKCEAYNFPQGVICQLFRDIAAMRPGCVTHIGLDTFVDPNHSGGKMNDRTTEDLVERVRIGERDWLWYKSIPIHVGIIRATGADPLGNLTYDDEAFVTEPLAVAQAAHNHGGIVIAQVKTLLDKPAHPHMVRVPGVLVDHIVVAENRFDHMQTWDDYFRPQYVTPQRVGESLTDLFDPMPLDERRIIAARAIELLPDGALANLGIGMPEGVARIAAERGQTSQFTLTVESGVIGGAPESGFAFGTSVHPEAIIDQAAMFDFYDGGGLDFAALGLAQVDRAGNVNVSRFGSKIAGLGGFANITQTARRLVFCGTFTAGGLKVAVRDGKLHIEQEGKIRKFVEQVEQVTFSANRSRKNRQDVTYVTERAVFKLTEAGIELTEIAPGIDMQTQVLDLMDCKPIVRDVQTMAARYFELPTGENI